MIKNPLLQKGDVVEIKVGMTVDAPLPKRFVYANAVASTTTGQKSVKVGNILTSKFDAVAIKNKIAVKIHEAFKQEMALLVPSEEILNFVAPFLDGFKTETFDTTELLVGEYVVINTAMEGGGIDRFDTITDGHRVYCKKMMKGVYDPDGIEIAFYQTGSFTPMIKSDEIQPIRTLQATFI